jgi:hypothetical protein
MADDLRKHVGIALRFLVAVPLSILWVVYFWWWIAGIIIGLSLLGLVLQPVIYPVIYPVAWLCSAFLNSHDPVLPHYWDHYPDKYFDVMGNALQLGFRALAKWTLEGPDKS